MSLRAILWALEEVHAPSAHAKLALIAFANYAGETNLAYPSLATVARITQADPKTVRKAVGDLVSAGLLVDTGKRTGVGKQVIVYALPVPALPDSVRHGRKGPQKAGAFNGLAAVENPALPDSVTHEPENPCPTGFGNTGFGARALPDSVSEPVKEPIPLETPNGVSVPKGTEPVDLKSKKNRGCRIPDGWSPPAIETLPERIADRVAQWPDGSYADQADAFVAFWQTESGVRASKTDWDKAWHTWIRRAGIPKPPPPSRVKAQAALAERLAEPPVCERDDEGEAEGKLRTALDRCFAGQLWWSRAALKFTDPGLRVYVAHSYQRDQAECAQGLIRRVAAEVGLPIKWVVFDTGKGRAAA